MPTSLKVAPFNTLTFSNASMLVSSLLFRFVRVVLPLCTIANLWLYFYPFFHRCGFPKPTGAPPSCNAPEASCTPERPLDEIAPFRLLAFGDPQLEGDSSLPNPNDPVFPSLSGFSSLFDGSTPRAQVPGKVLQVAQDTLSKDLIKLLKTWRKQMDLWGNDYYLAHIYRTLRWWSEPTHVTVLGDLLGSQWISDEEFERRSDRYWNRVFQGAGKPEEDVMRSHSKFREDGSEFTDRVTETLGEDEAWSGRVVNIVGNHDIGYAGDIDARRIERFERVYGRVNWDIRFELPRSNNTANLDQPHEGAEPSTPNNVRPSIHVVVLNTMNLDSPARDTDAQKATYDFLGSLLTYRSNPVEDRTSFTLLLTHIPLHKPKGVCVDAPFFDYFPGHWGGGIKEQNHLTEYSTKNVLEGVLGMSGNEETPMRGLGRKGLIINGHDHEGCDTWHHITTGDENWQVTRYENAALLSNESGKGAHIQRPKPGIRELTLRAMMGEYGGNAGLVSIWFDWNAGEWNFDVNKCALGVQHWWWAVHIADFILLVIVLGASSMAVLEKLAGMPRKTKDIKEASVEPAGKAPIAARNAKKE